MESARLEKYKHQYKFFGNEIDKLQRYLADVNDNHHVIKPEIVSSLLKISELDAIFLLSLAVNEHLLQKKYYVFTKNENNPLGEFDTSSSIPKYIVDETTGREVYKDHYYVDIAFEVA